MSVSSTGSLQKEDSQFSIKSCQQRREVPPRESVPRCYIPGIYYYHCAADALNIAFVRLWNTEYFIISYSIRVCTGLHSGPFYVVLSRLDQIMKNNCNTIIPVL